MTRVRISDSVSEFSRDQWSALFPNELEGYDYLLATERAGLEGFRWRYAVAEANDRLLAAAPGFLTEYALDTTLTGLGRRVVSGLRRLAPGALTLRLACLGSPCTETVLLGFAPHLAESARGPLLAALTRAFEAEARAHACGLWAAKDVPTSQQALWEKALWPAGYRPVPGLPVASLNIDFADVEAYLARLSSATRKDMRRKLRARERVRIERRHNIDDVLDRVLRLYADTRQRADMQFEALTPAYFKGVLEHVPGAICSLYFVGQDLLAANLLIEGGGALLDKFFCMNAEAGRAHNLYFLSWFENIEYCLERGLTRYQSGQAAYANKLRLGSTLCRTSMYFRHRNPLINSALQVAAPLFTSEFAPAPGA